VPPPHGKLNKSPFWKKRLRECWHHDMERRGMGYRSLRAISGIRRGIIFAISQAGLFKRQEPFEKMKLALVGEGRAM
jgi:hypothetical protein